jgi:enoyl-CoA hydratase
VSSLKLEHFREGAVTALYSARQRAAYDRRITAMKPDVILRKDGVLGHITLNRPKVLNALTYEMCASIYETLQQWVRDPSVHAILIDAVPGRAFCAGGDIRTIYELGRNDIAQAEAYFATEYRLNAAIRHCPKTYIALLDGITMGGGAGLSVHGSRRLVTERASFAMPETAIGLYPDIGGTYFLSRLPGEIGAYLALTGERIGPADMLWSGLATDYVPSDRAEHVTGLLAEGVTPDEAIAAASGHPPGEAQLSARACDINEMFAGSTVEEIIAKLESGGEWPKEVARALATRSPTSLKLTLRSLREARQLDFDGCMRMEYRLTLRVLRGHDLYEGVRAILIDRDQRPRWNPDTLAGVSEELIGRYFAPLGDKELVL